MRNTKTLGSSFYKQCAKSLIKSMHKDRHVSDDKGQVNENPRIDMKI